MNSELATSCKLAPVGGMSLINLYLFDMEPIDIRIKVDIDNDRIVDDDIVKLSKGDIVIDYLGNEITLKEGMYVYLYTDDTDSRGESSFIFSEGIVIKSPYGALTLFKWFCKLKGEIVYVDKNGEIW